MEWKINDPYGVVTSTPVYPTKNSRFDYSADQRSSWAEAKEIITDILHVVFKPVRLLVIAYTHVLTGTPVEKPYKWSEI